LDCKIITIFFSQKHRGKTKIRCAKPLFNCFSIIPSLHLRLCGIFCIGLFIFSACAFREPSRAFFSLGTLCTITLYEQGQNSVYNEIIFRINEIENLMSVNIPSSDISRINAAAGTEKVQVHKDTFFVIERAVFFARLGGGAFDPTVGPLVSLWGIGDLNERIPSREEIEQALPLINWRNIFLDSETCSVYLSKKGMALDLGAIAKGYATDEAAKIIKNAGINRAIVDLGGNIITIGTNKNRPWRIGIQKPGTSRGETVGVLQITEKTVVTSGSYERFFIENDRHYHHLFSPFTGYPAKTGLLSVTIITNISMNADALSTAVFVLGYEKGMELINTFEDTEAVFIFEDKSIITTSNTDFNLTDNSFYFK